MAISFVAASPTVQGSNPTVTVPTGIVQGDLLVIFINGTPTTPATPAGWTSRAAEGSQNFLTIFYKFATGTETSVSFTSANLFTSVVMTAYRGVSANDTIGGFDITTSGGSSLAAPTFSTTYANEFVVTVWCQNASGFSFYTPPASTNVRVNTSSNGLTGNGLLVVDELKAATGVTTSRTATASLNGSMASVAFAIIPSGRYWVGGTGTWTTTTTNWAFSSGGASGAPAPTAQDPVFFDQAATYAVTLTGALTCFDLTVSAGTVTFSSTGTISNSGSISLIAGTVWAATGLLTFNSTSTGRTVTTNAVTINSPITFNGVGGAWSLGSALSTGVTLTTTLTNGSLILNGFNLTTGIFSSNNANTRVITFGTNNIVLSHTTAAQTVLDMAVVTGLTLTGTGGFTSTASVTRTYTFGTTGGTSANSPNLSLTDSGTAVQTFTTGSWFNLLSFGTTAFNPGTTTLNLNSLTLSSGGTFTTLTPTMVGSGTITSNTNTTLALLPISCVGGTTSLGDTLTMTATSTVNLINGTINLNGFNLTTGIFSSSTGAARGVTFGSNFIYLVHTTAGTNVLLMANSASFAPTGSGGFSTAMTVTRSFSFGSTGGGTTTSAPNLFITSGAAIPTFTTASWFNNLDFTGSSTTPAASVLNITGSLTLSTGGTYTSLGITMVGTGTITPNGKTIAAFTVNTAGTVTLAGALGATTYTQTSGTVDFATNNLTCSGAASFAAGTLTNIGTISCTTWAETGTFVLSSGTISASTSYTVTSGSFTYSGGTITTPSFVHTAGTVTLTQPLTLTGSYTLTAGTVTITNLVLTCTGFLSTGTGVRSIVFGTTGQITLTGNAITIWDGGGTGITYTGTPTIVSNYTGSVGTRTINVGTGWTEATDFNVKVGSAVGISIGSGGTDTVAIAGVLNTLDLTGMTFTYSPGVMTVYGSYTIPATGGSVSASANLTTFASTQVTPIVITVSRTIDFPITFSGVGGTFNLGYNFTTGATRTTTLTSGVLALNGYNYSTGLFSSAGALARTISFGTNNITVTGSGTVWDTGTITNLTITGTPVVNVTNATATATTVNSGALPESTAISFNFTAGTYALTFLGTAGYTADNVNFTGFAGTLAATAACTVYGNYTISSGMTVTTSANTLTFGGTSGTSIITSNTKTLPPISINGLGGTFNLGSDLTTSGSLQVLAGSFSTSTSNYAINGTILDSSTNTNTRSISLNGSTITLSLVGAAITLDSTNLTFNAGTSQITLTGLGTVIAPVSISAIGGVTFYNVSYTGLGYFNFSTISTYNNFTFTSPSTITLVANPTINGALTSTGGSVSSRSTIQSDVPSTTQRTLSAGSVSLSDINFAGINAAGAAIPFTGTRLGNLGNNTNITFTDGTNKYWSLAAGGNWNSVAWATTSGGTPDANNYPLPQDTCIIQNTGLNTSATITMNVNATFTTINMSARTNAMTLSIPNGIVLNVLGDWITGSGVGSIGSVSSTGGIYFSNIAGGTSNITSAGKLWSPPIYVNGNVTVKLLDALAQNTATFNSALYLLQGSINLNNFDWTCSNFLSQGIGGTIRSINFGSGFINLTSITVGAVNLNIGNSLGFSATGTGGFKANMSITRQFAVSIANGTSPSPPNLFINAGASVPTFTVESSFTTLDFTGSTCTPAANTVDIYNLVLATGGTYTGLTVNTLGTGTITGSGKTIVALNCLNGTTTISGTLTAPTTVNGGTLVNPTGAILNTATLTLTTGTVNLTGGTLPTTATFTHTAGTLNVTASTSLTATSTYGFTSGAINLSDSAILSVGIFSSAVSGVRSIAFGSTIAGNINLTHTTAATVVLSMADLTGFSYTGLGGFTVATMTNTRTFTVGTTAGATSTNAPSLTFTTGASVASITTAGWFNKLDYGTTSFGTTTTTLNVNSITLSLNGTYAALSLNLRGSGTLTYNGKTTSAVTLLEGSPTIADTVTCSAFTVNGGTWNFTTGTLTPSSFIMTSGSFTYNGGTLSAVTAFTHTAGTVRFNNNYSLTAIGTYTFTAGTLTINDNITLTTGIFSSTNANTRTINFGLTTYPGYIALSHTTAATVVLSMATVTGLTVNAITNNVPAGGFVSDTSITRTFTCGTVGGNAANSPCLHFTGGTALPTFTTGSWYNILYLYNLGNIGTLAATTLNLNGLVSSPNGGVYTNMSVNFVGTGIAQCSGVSSGPVNINNGSGLLTLFGALVSTTCTLTAGSVDFNGYYITPATTFTYVGGTFVNGPYITCTTFTLNGPTFTLNAPYQISPNTSFVVTTGSFILNDGTLPAVPTFTQTAGSVTFNVNYALTVTGTYTLTAGTLILPNGVTLSTGIFSSNNSNTRSIGFGSTSAGNIQLTSTNTGAIVLVMNTTTGFTFTGTGGFTVADMSNTRSFVCGLTGGTVVNSPNLTFTTGASVATITTGGWFNNLDFGTTSFAIAATSLTFAGNLTLSLSGTYAGLTATLAGVGTSTLTTNGKPISALTINGTGAFTFADAVTVNNILTLTVGTIYASYNITSGSFASTGTATRGIIGTNITYVVSGTGATAFSNASGTGLTMTGFVISMTAGSAKTFAGGGGTYPVLNNGGSGLLTISGSNTFDTISNSVQPTLFQFTSGTTQTVRNFNVAGTPGNLVTITSTLAGSVATLTKSSGIVYGSYLSIQDSTATGGATWYAGPTSTSVSNNTGWIFTPLPIITMGNLTVADGGFVISNNPVVFA
jgi:hypothetical protein